MVDPWCSSHPASAAWIFGDASATCGNLRPWTKEAEAKSIVSIVSVEIGIRNLKKENLPHPSPLLVIQWSSGHRAPSTHQASDARPTFWAKPSVPSSQAQRHMPALIDWQTCGKWRVFMLSTQLRWFTIMWICVYIYIHIYIYLSIPSTVSAGPSRRNWSYAPTTLPPSLYTLPHQHYMASSAVQSTITIYKVHNANHLCLSEHLSIGDSPLVIGNISGVSGPVFRHIHIHGQIPSLLKPPYFW